MICRSVSAFRTRAIVPGIRGFPPLPFKRINFMAGSRPMIMSKDSFLSISLHFLIYFYTSLEGFPPASGAPRAWGVPQGSGLGASSILLLACIRALLGSNARLPIEDEGGAFLPAQAPPTSPKSPDLWSARRKSVISFPMQF